MQQPVTATSAPGGENRAGLHLPQATTVVLLFGCLSGRPAFISMVEAGSLLRRVSSQREVRPGLVIIRDKRLHVLVRAIR